MPNQASHDVIVTDAVIFMVFNRVNSEVLLDQRIDIIVEKLKG